MTNEAERIAFEAWYVAQATKAGLTVTAEDMVSMRREGNTYDEGYAFLRGAWKGWEARSEAPTFTEVTLFPVFSVSGTAEPMLEISFTTQAAAEAYAKVEDARERLSPMHWYVGHPKILRSA